MVRDTPPRPTLADDGGSRPECSQCGETYSPMDCVQHRDYPSARFCSMDCAQMYEAERTVSPAHRPGTPEDGGHHALGDEARLDAMERAGEVLEDTQRAGGSAASGVLCTRPRADRAREWFERSRILADELGLGDIVCRDSMNYLSLEVSVRR